MAGALWQAAAALGARRHRHQIRKDGETPYYSHCVRVAMTVAVVFGCDDEVALAAALLHDTIEDTATDYDDVADACGVEVADVVATLTKNMALPEHVREPEYHGRLERGPWRARLVKLADQYDNLTDTATLPVSRRESHLKKTLVRCEEAVAITARDTEPAIVRGRAKLIELIAAMRG